VPVDPATSVPGLDPGRDPGRDPLAALFPDESVPVGSPGRRHLSRGRRRVLIALAIVAVVVAVVATRAVASGGPSYRTATVEQRSVGAILDAVATVEPVSQAAIAFPTSGTVATVTVKAGDHVAAGQAVATLDTTSLEQTLHDKEAALATAQLNLEKATSGQSVSLPNSSGGSVGSGNFSGNGSSAQQSAFRTGETGTSGVVLVAATSDPQLQQAQQAVLNAQHQVDVALAAASAALDHATTVCAQVGVDPSTTTTTTTTAPTSTTVPTDALAACQQALNDVLTAQKAVQTAQASLADASKAYDDLLGQRAATSGSGSTPSAGSGSGGTSGTTSGGTGSSGGAVSGGFGGSSGSTGSSPSSSDLVAFQKAVDAAQDQVAVAQQALAQATITSPIDGTVVSVTMAPGDSVTAASTTADIVVKGGGGFQATSSLSVTKIAKLKVGQTATVLPDGAKAPLAGKVVAISAAPTSTTSSSTTYRVVVAIDATGKNLQNGATGDLTVVTDATKAGLAVPTSAITTRGNRHTVLVPDGEGTRVVSVQVGAMGPTWTVVKSGLTRGQQVVLADRSAALPGSATSSTNSTTRTGTFPGGGNFPTFGRRTN
jgi:HlyD family secretion protein